MEGAAADAGAPPLSIRGLRKTYGAAVALAGVDLDVAPGELVGLLGPNGAGKTTLTKVACGLTRASAGEIEVCGQPAGSLGARSRTGYLAELFRFPGWLSAEELLELHQRLAGSSGGEEERGELLELVGLAEARGKRVERMSKGMQQRLGIAQALIGEPHLLLLDEPTSALDPHHERQIVETLASIRGRRTIILVTHRIETTRDCDGVFELKAGRVVGGIGHSFKRPRRVGGQT